MDKETADRLKPVIDNLGVKLAPPHTLHITPQTTTISYSGRQCTLAASGGFDNAVYADPENRRAYIISPFAHPKVVHKLAGHEVQGYHTFGYHAIRHTPMDCPPNANPRLVGFELEVYRDTDFKASWFSGREASTETRNMPSCRVGGQLSTYGVVERDGSLGNLGVEIVTRPGPLAAHARPLHLLCSIAGVREVDVEKEARRIQKAQYYLTGLPYGICEAGSSEEPPKNVTLRSGRCSDAPNGMHINVSMEGLDVWQANLYAAFWYVLLATCNGHRDHIKLWAKWARRPAGEYGGQGVRVLSLRAALVNLSAGGDVSGLTRSVGRLRDRSSIGAGKNTKLYEARCFRGTLDFDFIMSRAAAMVAVADVMSTVDVSALQRKLKPDDYAAWVGFMGVIARHAVGACANFEGKDLLAEMATTFDRASQDITNICDEAVRKHGDRTGVAFKYLNY